MKSIALEADRPILESMRPSMRLLLYDSETKSGFVHFLPIITIISTTIYCGTQAKSYS